MSTTTHAVPVTEIYSQTSTARTASPGRAKPSGRSIHQPVRILQGITILMVVYAHSVIPGHHFSGWAELVDRFVRAVAVPMFMSISGFLYCLANQGSRPYGRLMKEKVHRLVLPYVVLSSLAYVIKASLGHVASRPLNLPGRLMFISFSILGTTPSFFCGFCRPYSSFS